jgi:hypothetical protein
MHPVMADDPKSTKSAARQSGSFHPPKSSAVAKAPKASALTSAAESSPAHAAGRADGT